MTTILCKLLKPTTYAVIYALSFIHVKLTYLYFIFTTKDCMAWSVLEFYGALLDYMCIIISLPPCRPFKNSLAFFVAWAAQVSSSARKQHRRGEARQSS